MAAPFCITKYPDGFKLKFMYHPMLVKCVNNIPSVKANAKKAYLFNERRGGLTWLMNGMLIQWRNGRYSRDSAVPYNGRSKERSI